MEFEAWPTKDKTENHWRMTMRVIPAAWTFVIVDAHLFTHKQWQDFALGTYELLPSFQYLEDGCLQINPSLCGDGDTDCDFEICLKVPKDLVTGPLLAAIQKAKDDGLRFVDDCSDEGQLCACTIL